MLLQKENIRLRALESTDIEWLYNIENNTAFWEISNTIQPFSAHVLTEYLAQAALDIFTTKQLRLVICDKELAVGLIDLFDFDPIHHRAGIGILIEEAYQSKGIAKTAIEILIEYAISSLQLHQLYANITTDNKKSIALFEKVGFSLVGTKRDWTYNNGTYKDEYLYQKIFP